MNANTLNSNALNSNALNLNSNAMKTWKNNKMPSDTIADIIENIIKSETIDQRAVRLLIKRIEINADDEACIILN